MTADLGLITHTTQRHAHELAIGGTRDALPQAGLAYAGRTDQAQDGAFDLVDPLQHSQIFDDALFDLFEAIVVFIQHFLGVGDVLVHA